MNCDRMEVLMPDHAIGRLPHEQNSKLESHLESCGACRTYLGHIRELYDVPLPYMAAPPAALVLPSERTNRWRPVLVLAALAATVLVYFNWPREQAPSGEVGVQRVKANLASLSIDLPELPIGSLAADWVNSESEARLLSEYSGKPMLLQYVNADCNRCLGVVRLMEEPECEGLLEEFVCFRSEVQSDAPPSVLEGRAPKGKLMLSLPAMFVRAESFSTDPSMAISCWGDVEDVVADYASNCDLQGIEILRALEDKQFEEALEQMRGLPDLMEAGSYNQVLASLQSIGGLGERYDTRFAEEAQRMENELMDELEEVVCELESMREDGGEVGVQSMAQNLMPGLSDTPFAGRVQMLAANSSSF
jgi:hypothetical protein